ncbi:hypothetical protein ERJ75_001506300 [Trypanosoma vivax]|nr:hypothetical protein ERJ75_001506300 [Trypanosoma vivax]
MYMARSTKAPHAPEMKIPSNRRGAFRPITEAEPDVALRELSSGTAPGDDEVKCEELKQLGRETKKCVVRLFNCSLRTGQVPSKWGHGIIVPLLKPNKPASSMPSFRPATLTSTLRKLMERIVARRVGTASRTSCSHSGPCSGRRDRRWTRPCCDERCAAAEGWREDGACAH